MNINTAFTASLNNEKGKKHMQTHAHRHFKGDPILIPFLTQQNAYIPSALQTIACHTFANYQNKNNNSMPGELDFFALRTFDDALHL